MDAQDREGKIRGREEKLARRFGQALDQVNIEAVAKCPDAEIIAAYADQSLEPAELAQCEGHFAKCARCRKILSVLAASADTPLAEKEVAQLGELVSGTRAPLEITTDSAGRARGKFGNLRTRWLAPAIGVAAVLAVWFAIRPPWRASNRADSTTLIAQAPKEERPLAQAPAPADRESQVAPMRDQKAQTASPPDRVSAKSPSVNPPVGTPAETRTEAGNSLKKVPASDALAITPLPKDEKSGDLAARSDVVAPAAPAPAPPPPPPAKSAQEIPAPAPPPEVRFRANAAAPSAPAVPGSTSQTVTVTEAAPLIETTNGALGGTIQQGASADLPVNGRNFQALEKLGAGGEFAALLRPRSGSALWRAGKGGIIERSTDMGKTWAPQISPTTEDWLAGTAITDKACWLVGVQGAIARTTDGRHWKMIAPPAAAADANGAFPDWLAITATNKNAAAIVARDGRKFTTTDGGKAWRVQ